MWLFLNVGGFVYLSHLALCMDDSNSLWIYEWRRSPLGPHVVWSPFPISLTALYHSPRSPTVFTFFQTYRQMLLHPGLFYSVQAAMAEWRKQQKFISVLEPGHDQASRGFCFCWGLISWRKVTCLRCPFLWVLGEGGGMVNGGRRGRKERQRKRGREQVLVSPLTGTQILQDEGPTSPAELRSLACKSHISLLSHTAARHPTSKTSLNLKLSPTGSTSI